MKFLQVRDDYTLTSSNRFTCVCILTLELPIVQIKMTLIRNIYKDCLEQVGDLAVG